MSIDAQMEQLIETLRDVQHKMEKAPGDLAAGLTMALDTAALVGFPADWITDRRRDSQDAVDEMDKAKNWVSPWCSTQCDIIRNCFSLRDAEAAYATVSFADLHSFFVTDKIVGNGWESDSRELYRAKVDAVPAHLGQLDEGVKALADAFGHLAKAVEDRDLALAVSLVGFGISLVGWIISVAALGSPAAPIAIAGVILSTLGLAASVWAIATLPDPTSEATAQTTTLGHVLANLQAAPWPTTPSLAHW